MNDTESLKKPADFERVPEVLKEIPARIAIRYGIFPLKKENGVLKVLSAEDFSRQTKEEIRIVVGKEMDFISSGRVEIEELIAKFYGVGAGVIEMLTGEEPAGLQPVDVEIIDQDKKQDATVTRLVNELILDALSHRASDIHVEPFERSFRIRYRIDGLMREANVSEKIRGLAGSLLSRIKIMAKLDIGERRLPQDGRIKIKHKTEELDLRVSVLPSSFGEAIVLRILRPLRLLAVEQLGFEKEMLETARALLQKPQGMILVTGPTGSGKTTTLYAFLQEINQIERKILTIEDPIEYKLHGIIQTQVNSKTGFGFTQALRSMLRHDPDILMVGEIRDTETAKIAISSALTGHLVFSTLHTNDAPSAVVRLLEMGIESYLAASAVEAVLAQRLVRRVCPDCYGRQFLNCGECKGTGYSGRIAIYEWMPVSENIRRLILEKSPASAIRDRAIQEGMIPLEKDGMKKVSQGLTSLEELKRVIG